MIAELSTYMAVDSNRILKVEDKGKYKFVLLNLVCKEVSIFGIFEPLICANSQQFEKILQN